MRTGTIVKVICTDEGCAFVDRVGQVHHVEQDGTLVVTFPDGDEAEFDLVELERRKAVTG